MVSPPSYIDQVNAVVTLIENPCDEPWTVYLELAKRPAGNLALGLLTFGMGDVARGFAKPKTGRTRRRGKKRAGRGRLKFGIPETGNMLGSLIPGSDTLKAAQTNAGLKFMWRVDDIVQRGLWYWLILDLVGDFLYEWSTLIQATQACAAAAQGRLLYTASSGAGLGILGWQALSIPQVVYDTPDLHWNVAAGTVPAGRWNCCLTCNSTNTGLFAHERQVGLFPTSSPVDPYGLSDRAFVLQGGTAELIAFAVIDGPATITAQQFTSAGSASITDASIFIMGL